MRVSIAFSGAAWTGVVTAGYFLGKILAAKGYYVIGDKEYESIIKWGNNLFVLYISDECNYISKKIDYFFSYDKYWIEKNQKIYDLKKIIEINKADCNYQNTYSMAMALGILGVGHDELKSMFEEKFGKKPDVLKSNLDDIDKWGSMIEKSEFDLSAKVDSVKAFLHGNEIIAEGAMASDLKFYSAYPMTPASSIIDTVVKNKNVTFFQWEDEIAVSMSMLGAHFAGKRSMCGTSGGGFALMTESISYANMAELGGVYIFSQRAGPSTGTPTFTEQSDLNFALNATFGNTYPIVVAPSNFENGYNLIGKCLNWSDQYQHPVICMIDKMYSETFIAVDEKDLKAEKPNRWKMEGKRWKVDEKFARYEVTEDGVSPYTIPGVENGEFIATSYEHDIYGATSEDPLEKKIMTEKRMKKIEKTFVKEVFNKDFYGYEIVNPEASKFVVTWGFNQYVLKDLVNLWKIWEKGEWGLIVVTVIQPVDPRLTDFFEKNMDKIEWLLFVEQNYSGQLEQHIKTQCGLRIPEWEVKIDHERKYANYPFFEEDFGRVDNW